MTTKNSPAYSHPAQSRQPTEHGVTATAPDQLRNQSRLLCLLTNARFSRPVTACLGSALSKVPMARPASNTGRMARSLRAERKKELPTSRGDAFKLRSPSYLSSEPCHRGHVGPRVTATAYCLVCAGRASTGASRPE